MRTEIAELGEFGLIDRLTKDIVTVNPATVRGVGDDAAVIDFGQTTPSAVPAATPPQEGNHPLVLLSSDMLLEGVDFDLMYFPLRHLGYKAVTVGASDILAMNGLPSQLTLSVGVSAKLSVEDLEEFYAGARKACEELGCDLVGGDTTASVTGFAIAVSVVGTVPRDRVVYRSGARANDLICITRDLGAAYLGLHLLEREKRALADSPNPEPKFEGYEYLLERQLRPRARKDVIDALAAEGIVPTSMIDISDGLASDLLQTHLSRPPAHRAGELRSRGGITYRPGGGGAERRRRSRTSVHRASRNAGKDSGPGPGHRDHRPHHTRLDRRRAHHSRQQRYPTPGAGI